MNENRVKEELSRIPDQPGVYLYKNKNGEIIYVGKAKSLKKRVRQYFSLSGDGRPMLAVMVPQIEEIEYIITDNEVEALILEATLIKKHWPKYNSALKDDKQYPYIKITMKDKYPRVVKVRKILKDGAKYFGPYVSSYAVDEVIEVINELFKLRKCKHNLNKPKRNMRVCLNYHIHRCSGPCAGYITEDDYAEEVKKVIRFLSGTGEEVRNDLEEKMKAASGKLDFEEAAKFRDKIKALDVIHRKQKIDKAKNVPDHDIIGIAVDEIAVNISMFFVRNGKIVGKENFELHAYDYENRPEIIQSFILQFYTGTVYVPKEIYIETEIEDKENIENMLMEKRGNRVTIKTPFKGEKKRLIFMAKKNAIDALNKKISKNKKKNETAVKGMINLQNMLSLEGIHRIEAYDISNIQGVQSVGSMVVFEDGLAANKEYRRFKIKTIEGPNDYGSMEEILERRFNRALSEKESSGFSKLPDLILMDGGKGQVHIAERVLENFGLQIPVAGMVKDDKHTTNGLYYLDEEIAMKRNSDVYKLVWAVQEEAHRFAINYHRNLRDKTVFKSELDHVPNIGEKRKINLLRHFGSVDEIKKQNIHALSKVDGMNKLSASQVYKYFHNDDIIIDDSIDESIGENIDNKIERNVQNH